MHPRLPSACGRDGLAWFMLGGCGSLDASSNLAPGPPLTGRSSGVPQKGLGRLRTLRRPARIPRHGIGSFLGEGDGSFARPDRAVTRVRRGIARRGRDVALPAAGLRRHEALAVPAATSATTPSYSACRMGEALPQGDDEALRLPEPREGAAMIKQAEKAYAPLEGERQVHEFWKRAKVYPKVVAARRKGEDFFFVDGPPYTTGSIHLGQVLNKTVKDAVIRWRRMQGYNVRDQPGYDMHGLPIEVQVERTLGITNKREIEELGIEKFVTTCRNFSLHLLT